MSRLVSKRVKLRNQVGLTSDRYQFLGLEQAEPNLGDPLVGPSSIGANPEPSGLNFSDKYVLISAKENIGKRYWATLESIGAGATGPGIVSFSTESKNVIGGIGIITQFSVINNGISSFSGISTFYSTVSISSSTPSTSPTTGALIVNGGIGVSGSLYAASNIEVNGISIGRYANPSNTEYNFFVGDGVGLSNQNGVHNNFLGYYSANSNISGSYNNFFGKSSGFSNIDGSSNNFFGESSGFENINGSSNNFLGKSSGLNNTSGSNNQFIGRNSGYKNDNGSKNIFIGDDSGYNNESGNENIVIGSNHNTPIVSGSRQLAIGIGNTSWIVGTSQFNIGIGVTNPTTKLEVNGDVKVGVNTSQGIILTSPNGTKYRLIVDNLGNISSSLVS